MSGVVSDTSPLIALHQIGQLGLLETIFGTVLMPPAAAREAPSIERPAWLLVWSLEKPSDGACTRAGLREPRCSTLAHRQLAASGAGFTPA